MDYSKNSDPRLRKLNENSIILNDQISHLDENKVSNGYGGTSG
jgi:hypothetical protein